MTNTLNLSAGAPLILAYGTTDDAGVLILTKDVTIEDLNALGKSLRDDITTLFNPSPYDYDNVYIYEFVNTLWQRGLITGPPSSDYFHIGDPTEAGFVSRDRPIYDLFSPDKFAFEADIGTIQRLVACREEADKILERFTENGAFTWPLYNTARASLQAFSLLQQHHIKARLRRFITD